MLCCLNKKNQSILQLDSMDVLQINSLNKPVRAKKHNRNKIKYFFIEEMSTKKKYQER